MKCSSKQQPAKNGGQPSPAPPTPNENAGKQEKCIGKGNVSKIGKKEKGEMRAVSCWCKSKDAKPVERSIVVPRAIPAKGPENNYGNLTGKINFAHGGGNKDAEQ